MATAKKDRPAGPDLVKVLEEQEILRRMATGRETATLKAATELLQRLERDHRGTLAATLLDKNDEDIFDALALGYSRQVASVGANRFLDDASRERLMKSASDRLFGVAGNIIGAAAAAFKVGGDKAADALFGSLLPVLAGGAFPSKVRLLP